MSVRDLQLVLLALGLAIPSCEAQKKTPIGGECECHAAVRLEMHENQNQFTLGDPVFLDLVYTATAQGCAVNTDTTPYLPPSDFAAIKPKAGWVLSHNTYLRESQNGNAVAPLGRYSVRVPVLLNRTITFQKPGHYNVTLTTERLRASTILRQMGASPDACDVPQTTNTVGIDIEVRSEPEEAELVAALSRDLEQTREPPQFELSSAQKELVHKSEEALKKAAGSKEENDKQLQAQTRELMKVVASVTALEQKWEDTRRQTAVRLAYLAGDDAVRAKVHFIAEDKEGDARPIGPIMVDGLPSSADKQLQLDLLQSAWRDPDHVPTSILQTALRQAKELANGRPVIDEAVLWAGTERERQVQLQEYQGEINEIIATLPQRTEANRAKTIDYLKKLGVPNQFSVRRPP